MVESVIHVLRDCPIATRIWLSVSPSPRNASFFSMTTWDWVLHNINNCNVSSNGVEWSLIFGVSLWLIWQWRNRFVFENQIMPLDSALSNIHSRCQEINQTTSSCSELSLEKSSTHHLIHWKPPDMGIVKLNTDGSCFPQTLKAGAGGLFRNHNSEWLLGFIQDCGVYTSLEAELWGILSGLKIALQR